MLAPLSWLKDYIDITLPINKLTARLSEVGLGVENITKLNEDVIFELEITPNRPDLLSILGVAREIAAIEGKKVKVNIPPVPKPIKKMPFSVQNDFSLLEHYASIIITNVHIKDSPLWLKHRLVQIGLRPINNVVDITNYVMFELGIPLHAFDYNEIHGSKFFIEKSRGGEKFISVDKISYTLPKDAIIIKDADRLVDLVGIKGGLNSGIKAQTENILLQTSVDNPVLIRHASRSLSLRSDASNILEKGIDKNGLLPALARATNLILELAGGEVGSDVFELKQKEFKPWKLTLRLGKLTKQLGISIPVRKILDILASLNFDPKLKGKIITVTVPTYRNDVKIEEDIVEEVARLYGYNNFPKTIPPGLVSQTKTPYYKNYLIDQRIKTYMTAAGFSEIYTYSMLSEKDLALDKISPSQVLRIDNPVSRDFEYLRPNLKIGLMKALVLNKPNFSRINLFELGKVYTGNTINRALEPYHLAGISNEKNYYVIKGVLGQLFDLLGVSSDPSAGMHILDGNVFFELNLTELLEEVNFKKIFKPLPKYPPVIEDLAITTAQKVRIGEMIEEILQQSKLITEVSLLDQYKDVKTFHIVYQHRESNLTTQEVSVVRKRIIQALKEKFNARVKEY